MGGIGLLIGVLCSLRGRNASRPSEQDSMVYHKDWTAWCITRIGQYSVSQGLDSLVYHKDCMVYHKDWIVSQGLDSMVYHKDWTV